MRIKKLIMESLPLSQKGKSITELYIDTLSYCKALSIRDITKNEFIEFLSELDKEQSLVIFSSGDVRGTNHGFEKYKLLSEYD